MSINDDILQRNFSSPHEKLAINIMVSHYWLQECLKAVFAKEDITSQQYNILRILRGSHPVPLSTMQIRERMMDKMSDTSRLVSRLVDKDFVTKDVNDNDRRLVKVLINKKGMEMLKRLDPKVNNMHELLGNLSDKQANTMSDLLDKMRDKK